jgi:hypothetical protein
MLDKGGSDEQWWALYGYHDIRHNDPQNNNTQHNETQDNDTKHNYIQQNDTQHWVSYYYVFKLLVAIA